MPCNVGHWYAAEVRDLLLIWNAVGDGWQLLARLKQPLGKSQDACMSEASAAGPVYSAAATPQQRMA